MKLSEQEQFVVEVAGRFGMIDGAHHKQWVIDQMLRALLGAERYSDLMREWEQERRAEEDPWSPWDVGITP